jgi:hypothetical protein
MSRYTIPAQDPRYEVVVGWDDPLETVFGQVFDTTAGEDEEECVYWEGAGGIAPVRRLRRCKRVSPRLPPFLTRSWPSSTLTSSTPCHGARCRSSCSGFSPVKKGDDVWQVSIKSCSLGT